MNIFINWIFACVFYSLPFFFAVRLRRKRDSNPRYAFGVYTLSRRASSTTRASLLVLNYLISHSFFLKTSAKYAKNTTRKLFDKADSRFPACDNCSATRQIHCDYTCLSEIGILNSANAFFLVRSATSSTVMFNISATFFAVSHR